jgi:hypothetical protein
MTTHEIALQFPSNHPYASHISYNALFPSTTITLHDRPSTCADPYMVTHKSRGKCLMATEKRMNRRRNKITADLSFILFLFFNKK